ncbi:hypothetical protein B296_00045810 [Ensete ventricosum]|uniref:Uncharacterized protein n=1 Tax=Ensete ventricosum TaxID=4639 RepID=A0A426YN62_ENSVE|nr:hypothetical protein B296_00045810 [Ensete ventricosum]
MVLWTSSILWVIRRSCALRESVESEESMSGSDKLRTDAMAIDVGRLAALPKGAWSDSGGNRGRLSTGWVTGGCPSGDSIIPSLGMEAVWGYELGCWVSCSHLRTEGVEARVTGLPPRLVASREGHLPRGCQVLSVLATSDPPSSIIMLLGDPRCPKSQHDVVWLARAGTAQPG